MFQVAMALFQILMYQLLHHQIHLFLHVLLQHLQHPEPKTLRLILH
jgi:hypothetical protein